jgi:hypothetical protein
VTDGHDLYLDKHARVQGVMIPDTALGAFNFAVDDREWIEQKTKVVELVNAIAATSLGAAIRFAGVQGSAKPVASPDALGPLVATGKSEVFILTQAKKDPTVSVRLSIAPLALGLEVRCHGEELETRRRTILDDVLAIAGAVHLSRCVGGLRMGYIAPIVRSMASYPYPRPRPPRRHAAINVGAVVDVIDKPWQRSQPVELASKVIAMMDNELPSLARRHDVNGLTVLRWVEDLTDPSALDRGCTTHEEWLSRYLPTMIDGIFNDQGDAAEVTQNLEARAGVTKYDPRGKIAYVAVVILPDGEPEEHYWASALELVKKRATGDGAPVEKVRLIVPLRRLALAFAARAKAHGIDAVLYPGEGGRWWNPDPPGSWAYPPHP